MTKFSRWRASSLVCGATVLAMAGLLLPSRAEANDCGASVACACGDRVVASVVLDGDLNNCLGTGLTLAAGVLDCAGHQIAGPGDHSTAIGVVVSGFTGAGASGATVQNCRIRNFWHGVEIDSGSGNTLKNNVIFSNEVGVWVGDGATASQLLANSVRDNDDEGVHLGGQTSGALVAHNSFVNNQTENLYLLGTRDNLIQDNTLENSKASAIHVKDSSGSVFTDNTINDHDIHVRGDSSGNRFENTNIASGFIHFSAIEEDTGWLYPHDNSVVGGSILKASTCFEFDGSYSNTVSGTLVDTCRIEEEKEAGGLEPHDNVVNVVRIDPGTHSTSGRRRSGNLRLARSATVPGHYSFEVSSFAPQTALDPAAEEVHCSLSDFGGTILDVVVPAGALAQRGPGFRIVDRTGILGGLRRLDLRPLDQGLWRLQVSGVGQLGGADYPMMTLSCSIGDDSFSYTDFWKENPRGWKLRLR